MGGWGQTVPVHQRAHVRMLLLLRHQQQRYLGDFGATACEPCSSQETVSCGKRVCLWEVTLKRNRHICIHSPQAVKVIVIFFIEQQYYQP
jgi:hypothetical protein